MEELWNINVFDEEIKCEDNTENSTDLNNQISIKDVEEQKEYQIQK